MNFAALAAMPDRSALRMSRRQFGRAVAGTAALGGTLGTGLLRPVSAAAAPGSFAPVPIPGGTPALGGSYHVFGPASIDPIDAEPGTITNFEGFVGLAYLDGMVTQTNTRTGESQRFPFLNSDMRFMTGNFRGTDGQVHQGTFALVWVDVYQPRAGGQTFDQTHDLNPSTFPPVGLFWTLQIPDSSVQVELSKGSASLQASDVPIFDYTTIVNALFGGGPPPIAGTVSFKIVWSGVQQRVNIRNTNQVYGGFAGEFFRNTAKMEWTATVGDLSFASDPLATSSSVFAEIGHERNGSFFPSG
jgi:hypothetical protein